MTQLRGPSFAQDLPNQESQALLDRQADPLPGSPTPRQSLADKLGLAASPGQASQQAEAHEHLGNNLEEVETLEETLVIEEEEFEEPRIEPPPQLSEQAIKKRLYRLVTPKASGALKVPQALIDDFNDPDARKGVFLMFEKAGYDRDRCC